MWQDHFCVENCGNILYGIIIEEEIIRVLLRVKVNDAIARSDLLDWRRDYGEI